MLRSLPLWIIALAGALTASCGDECSNALDCAKGQVCFAGACKTPAGALRTCSRNQDCNPMNATPPLPYACQAGTCVPTVLNPPPIVQPDGGMRPADGGG